MENSFEQDLKTFLNNQKKENIIIKKIQTWKKNNFIKLDIHIKNNIEITQLKDCEEIHKLTLMWLKKEEIDKNINITVLAEAVDRTLFDLDDYVDSVGQKIKIELKHKVNDQKNYTGFLIEIKNDKLILKTEKLDYIIAIDDIKKAKIIPTV